MHPSEWVRRLLLPVTTRVRNLATRGVIKLTNDNRRAQALQVFALDETLDPVERFGEFGFVSRPPKGAEVLIICVGGDRNHAIAVATEYREARPKGLAEGESGLYSTAGAGSVAARLTLKANGDIEITAGTVTISGDATVAGQVADALGTMQEIRDTFNLHTHHHGGNAGETNPPTQPMA
jgi:phage gp45-like